MPTHTDAVEAAPERFQSTPGTTGFTPTEYQAGGSEIGAMRGASDTSSQHLPPADNVIGSGANAQSAPETPHAEIPSRPMNRSGISTDTEADLPTTDKNPSPTQDPYLTSPERMEHVNKNSDAVQNMPEMKDNRDLQDAGYRYLQHKECVDDYSSQLKADTEALEKAGVKQKLDDILKKREEAGEKRGPRCDLVS